MKKLLSNGERFIAILGIIFIIVIGLFTVYDKTVVQYKHKYYTSEESSVLPDCKLNINTATIEELDDLQYVGEATAKKIIDYRETYGDFESIDDLYNINGIGTKIIETNREYITLSD